MVALGYILLDAAMEVDRRLGSVVPVAATVH
jgi:hypothetical protein